MSFCCPTLSLRKRRIEFGMRMCSLPGQAQGGWCDCPLSMWEAAQNAYTVGAHGLQSEPLSVGSESSEPTVRDLLAGHS